MFVIREKEEARLGYNVGDYLAIEAQCRKDALDNIYSVRSQQQKQQLVEYFKLVEKTIVTDSDKINTKRIL